MNDISDIDPIGYFPIKMGLVPPSSIKMEKFTNLPPEQQKIFQLDAGYNTFIENKLSARKEGIGKYYQKTGNVAIGPIVRFMCNSLSKDWPKYFHYEEHSKSHVAKLECVLSDEILVFDMANNWKLIGSTNKYEDSFDALCMQIPEDVIVCTVPSNSDDFVSYAHLTSPSGWSAEWAIGKTFWEIHEKVLNSNQKPVIKSPRKIVEGVLRMPISFQRVGAITFRSDPILNRHPSKNITDSWKFDEKQKFLLRFERQTITSFPDINSFLFTIRTYYNDLTKPDKIQEAIKAFCHPHPDAYDRDFIKKYKEKVITFLKRKLNE